MGSIYWLFTYHEDDNMVSRIQLLLAAAICSFAALLTVSGIAAQDRSDDDKKADRKIREQDIYIPYEKLRQVFEKQGRGVFLPYDKFQELWQAAQDKTRPAAEIKPPVGALITEIDNEATVEKDVVRVKAKVKIEVLAEGWNEIPLRLGDAAITSATLEASRPAIVGAAGQGYRLLVEKKGKQPEQIELALEYARAITRTPGQNSVSFQAPQAPVSRWRVVIPQAGVKVNLHPLIGRHGSARRKKPDGGGEEARRNGRVGVRRRGPDGPHRLDAQGRRRHRPGGRRQRAGRTAGLDQRGRRSLADTTLAYSISRAELAQLLIDVPADQKVVNVFDANVRKWSVEPVEGGQRITAELFEPAKTAQQVTVELEKFAGEKAKAHGFRADGQGRGRGTPAGRRWWSKWPKACGPRPPRPSGLLQVDAAELPAALRSTRSGRSPTAMPRFPSS